METFSGHLWRSPASEFQERTRERFIAKLVNKMIREYVIKSAADPHRYQPRQSPKRFAQIPTATTWRRFWKIKGPPGIHITIHITFQSRWIPIKAWHSRLRHRLDTTLHMLSKSVKSIPGIYHPNRHRSCTPLSRSLVFASKGAIHRMKQIPQLLPQE